MLETKILCYLYYFVKLEIKNNNIGGAKKEFQIILQDSLLIGMKFFLKRQIMSGAKKE